MNDEVNEGEEVEQNDPIRDAFDAAVSEDKDEDNVKLAMISGGASFKNVTRLYNQYMIDAGMAISKEERDEIVSNILEDSDVTTEEGFDAAVDAITAECTGVTDKSAAALVRSWAKKNEVECYKKPKGSGSGRIGFASKFYESLVANPNMTKEEANAIIQGTGDHEDTSANVKSHESHYQAIRQLANNIAAA